MRKTLFKKQVRFPGISFQFPVLKPVKICKCLIKFVIALFVPQVTYMRGLETAT